MPKVSFKYHCNHCLDKFRSYVAHTIGTRKIHISHKHTQEENPCNLNVITLGLHLGYSWSPGSTLKEIGTRSALRLAQKASQTARWTALYTTSSPVSVTKAIGRQHNSTGKSHCVGLMFKMSRKI
jgi:hypothetical protein